MGKCRSCISQGAQRPIGIARHNAGLRRKRSRDVWCTIEAKYARSEQQGCDFVRAKPFRDRTKVRLANHRPLRAELGVSAGLACAANCRGRTEGRDG
jgi:hypothetical protein